MLGRQLDQLHYNWPFWQLGDCQRCRYTDLDTWPHKLCHYQQQWPPTQARKTYWIYWTGCNWTSSAKLRFWRAIWSRHYWNALRREYGGYQGVELQAMAAERESELEKSTWQVTRAPSLRHVNRVFVAGSGHETRWVREKVVMF